MTDKPKILIVDDRKENLLALHRSIEGLDAGIVEASSGNAALSASLTHDFAVAVLDVQMPEMDGYELAELLRGDPKTASLPIVFLTASSSEDHQVFRGYKAGAVDYIVKPYNPQVLRAKLAVFLELHRSAADLAEKVGALAASEERFRTLVMTVPDIVFRIDTEGRFTFLNEAVGLLGYSPADLIGAHFSAIMPPGDAEAVSRATVLPRFLDRHTGPGGAPRLFDERRTGDRRTTELEVRLIPRKGPPAIPGLLRGTAEELIVAEVSSSGLFGTATRTGRPIFLGTVGVIRDITERKRTELQLRRHREHLQDLVDARVREQSCLFRLSGLLTEHAESPSNLLERVAALALQGFPDPGSVRVSVTLDGHEAGVGAPGVSACRLASDIEVEGESRGAIAVFRSRAPDGDAPFPPEEHELLAAIASQLSQEAARRSGLERLRMSEARARALIEKAPDIITVLSATGVVLFQSPSIRESVGYESEECLGRNAWDFVHPEDIPSASQVLAEVLATPGQAFFARYRVRHKNGSYRFFEGIARNLLSDPAVCGIVVNARDMTESRLAMERLAESELRLRSLYEESPMAYQSLDAEGRILDVNPCWVHLFGFLREEVLGHWFGDLVVPEDRERFREFFRRFTSAGEITGAELSIRRKDGTVAAISYDGRVARSLDGAFRCTHCLIRDVTEDRRQEAERLRFEATSRHQQKLEAIGTLASGVAHEINNPLNIILNYGQLVMDSADDAARVRDYAGHILKESERVAVIVRNLLGFARQDKENTSPASVADIVARTLSLMRVVLRKDRIAIDCDVPEDLPMIRCRTAQLQQVLMNLLTNARDALNQRYPGEAEDKRIRIRATPFEQEGRAWVRIVVEDWGSGIPASIAGKVFDPFFTTKPRDKGTGLGLSISYGIVKEHGGELGFESEPGRGTRFCVNLPADRDPVEPRKSTDDGREE